MPSRPHTPTSPLYSPLTPPTQLDDEEELQLSAMIEDEAGYADYIEGLQHSDSDMATNSDDTTNQFEKTGSDRIAEFEEETARTRQAAREDATKNDAKQNEGEGSDCALNGHEDHNDPPERKEDAQNVGEDGFPRSPGQEVTPLRVQASWVSDALSACQANKKNPLNKGNALVVLNAQDPAASCLMDVSDLTTSGALRQLQQDAKNVSEGCISDRGLSCLIVLSSTPSSMPELISIALDASIENRTSAETAKARSAANSKIKAEIPQGNASVAPETYWTKAYNSFFRIIAGKKVPGLPKRDFSAALPQIESIVSIAQKYEAVHVVQNVFASLLVGYVENHTLYSTVAKEPVRCANVGDALKSRLVYDEAFKHLVGSNANFRTGKPYDGLSTDVQARVQSRSHQLYDERMHTMMRLMRITLPAEKKKKSKSANVDYPTEVVSPHEQPEAYCIVNIFRDWASEHIGYLENETPENARPSYLCAHETGCDTIAGFFRTIMAGGESYLPFEKVAEDWEQGEIIFEEDREDFQEIAKKSLAALKSTASDYVKDIVGSELQLRDRDTLDYLTCVKVGPEDVPWDSENDGESDEDMDED